MTCKQLIILCLATIYPYTSNAQTTTPLGVADIQNEISSKIAKVSAFSATVETGEESGSGADSISSSSLLVSKEFGWKILGKENGEAYQLVTDYNTFYQYYPSDKRVMKTTADRPELKMMLYKPATDMNPLNLIDPTTLKYYGTETFDGQTVYKIEGTTESQMMPGGPAIRRTVTALISVDDGLPRKTLESVGVSTGTTVYRNVKLNPPVSQSDFVFTPPAGVTVIDVNAQMQRTNRTDETKPGSGSPQTQP